MTYDKNQYFIIRADRAGVFFAKIADRRGSEVDLVSCRRIHGWSNACSLSQVATDGCGSPGGNNRHSVVVESMTVLGVIEIIPCTPAATENLLGQPVWRH